MALDKSQTHFTINFLYAFVYKNTYHTRLGGEMNDSMSTKCKSQCLAHNYSTNVSFLVRGVTNGIRQNSYIEFNALTLSTLKSNSITEWKNSQINGVQVYIEKQSKTLKSLTLYLKPKFYWKKSCCLFCQLFLSGKSSVNLTVRVSISCFSYCGAHIVYC